MGYLDEKFFNQNSRSNFKHKREGDGDSTRCVLLLVQWRSKHQFFRLLVYALEEDEYSEFYSSSYLYSLKYEVGNTPIFFVI
jgi:hypothetical protein